MVCVVLAAGYATRLYPLTKNFPKPLLKLKNKPILDWILGNIEKIEFIDSVAIISNHKFFNHFEKWAQTRDNKKPITVLDDKTTDNSNRLGAVKDLQFAIDELNLSDDLFVVAGDNVTNFSFSHFVDYFYQKNATCIMRYFEKDNNILKNMGVATVDNDDLVLNMVEKPQNPFSNWAIPPFYIYKKEDLPFIKEAINKGVSVDAPGSFIEYLCKKTDVYAYEMPGETFDIGDIESYKATAEKFSKNNFNF